jgi:hypothetical protein
VCVLAGRSVQYAPSARPLYERLERGASEGISRLGIVESAGAGGVGEREDKAVLGDGMDLASLPALQGGFSVHSVHSDPAKPDPFDTTRRTDSSGARRNSMLHDRLVRPLSTPMEAIWDIQDRRGRDCASVMTLAWHT